MEHKKQEMSRLRLAILPIADEELGKFLPMCGMIFLTIFAYSLLRAYKDTIVVQAPGAGPLLLPFLKTYTVGGVWLHEASKKLRCFEGILHYCINVYWFFCAICVGAQSLQRIPALRC